MRCPKCQAENPDTSQFCAACGASMRPSEKTAFSRTKTIKTPIRGIAKGSTVAEKYRINGELGKDGMGVVFKTEDTKLIRTIALKSRSLFQLSGILRSRLSLRSSHPGTSNPGSPNSLHLEIDYSW